MRCNVGVGACGHSQSQLPASLDASPGQQFSCFLKNIEAAGWRVLEGGVNPVLCAAQPRQLNLSQPPVSRTVTHTDISGISFNHLRHLHHRHHHLLLDARRKQMFAVEVK